MGRWAQQKRRGGGGPGTVSQMTLITDTAIDTPTVLIVIFDSPVTAGDFTPAAFEVEGVAATGVVQNAPAQLAYTALGWSLGADQAWLYSDVVAGVATPQSGTIP